MSGLLYIYCYHTNLFHTNLAVIPSRSQREYSPVEVRRVKIKRANSDFGGRCFAKLRYKDSLIGELALIERRFNGLARLIITRYFRWYLGFY